MAKGLRGGGSRRRKRARRAQKQWLGPKGGKKYVGTGIERVKRVAKKCGSPYFDPATMRFFSSRAHKRTYTSTAGKCTFFVTSEEGPSGGRKYSVRRQCGCKIGTVGEFQGYRTSRAAHAAAKRAAAKSKK